MARTRRIRTGPGWARQTKRWVRAARLGTLQRALASVMVEVVKERAFGSGGRGTDNRGHPGGGDLIRTGAMQSGFGILKVYAKLRVFGAEIGVSGPAAAYVKQVQARHPWMAPSALDRRRIRARTSETIRLAVGVSS